jgi:signal transduction histidine kinase
MEDDAAQARLVQKCLEREGYIVDVAADGNEGLACCEGNVYAAVIIDQTMPGLSGLEVIRTMSQRGPMPPIIMVTGTGNERIAVEAMKLGASDYLVKDLEGGLVNILPLVIRRAIQERRTLVEKYQMERELAQSRKMKAIGQLATGIAHEINTPTQYLGDNTRFLRDAFEHISPLLDDYERLLQAVHDDAITDDILQAAEEKLHRSNLDYWTAEIPQAIQQSLDGVKHVAGIVGAMKEFAHPDAIEKKPIDLNHVIENTIMLCYNEWKYVAEVKTDFDANLPSFSCQSSDIHRVVLNLIVNAAHAIAESNRRRPAGQGKITVRTRCDGSSVEIRVEDNGIGIAPEIRENVFDLFFTTKEVGRGTGQGLSIARAIVVENYGGTIQLESEVGRGTTFVVHLPLHHESDSTLDADNRKKIVPSPAGRIAQKSSPLPPGEG